MMTKIEGGDLEIVLIGEAGIKQGSDSGIPVVAIDCSQGGRHIVWT